MNIGGFNMDNKLSIDVPFRTVIVKILDHTPENSEIFGRTKEKDYFFQDLLTVGFDFYELLEIFVNCDAVTAAAIKCIINNIPKTETIARLSKKEFKRIVPHWSSANYRTSSIDDIYNDIKVRIKRRDIGAFIYYGNANRNKKLYNDAYVLFLTNSGSYFFDINKKKSFLICNIEEDDIK